MSEPPESLSGRHALVTGGGAGIGRAIALALDEAGASVSVLDLSAASAEETAAQFASGGGFAVADVTDEKAVRASVEARVAAAGPIAILVNNAGAAQSAPFAKMDGALWQRMLAINLTSVVLVSQAALVSMRGLDYGRIVNIASTAGVQGVAYVSAYAAAKHGVVGLTRSLALEFAKTPITVNAICPGYAETDLLERSLDNIVEKTGMERAAALAQIVEGNPQGRLIAPEEVAATVRWLCSHSARSITGQAIAIAGGEVM